MGNQELQKKPISIRITPRQVRELTRLVRELGVPQTELIRSGIDREIRARHREVALLQLQREVRA